jgi:hypothetical protein
MAVDPKDKSKIDKELRVLTKRAALVLPSMTPRSRLIVVNCFEKIDYYDADFIDAMKRLKIIK